jgi:hypothetical protein
MISDVDKKTPKSAGVGNDRVSPRRNYPKDPQMAGLACSSGERAMAHEIPEFPPLPLSQSIQQETLTDGNNHDKHAQ